MSSGAYVVTRPYPGSGLGSNLLSMAGAVWFASALGRDVVVDWRDSAFLKDKSLNYFTEFLEAEPEIQGVRVHYAAGAPDDLGAADAEKQEIAPSDCARLIRDASNAPDYLVLRAFHGFERVDPYGDAADHHTQLKDFYRWISPRADIRNEIDDWHAEHLGGAFVVGVNIATGNGEYAKGTIYHRRVDTSIFGNDAAFRGKITAAARRALRNVPEFLRDRSAIFFATDSIWMHEILSRVPNAVTRRTIFPPPGTGRVYCEYDQPGYTDRDAIRDAIVDMFMLARCNALIRNFSMFNVYAQVVTDYFNGNVHEIESRYARFWLRRVASRARRAPKRLRR